MKKAWSMFNYLLRPPRILLLIVAAVLLTILIYIFSTGNTESMLLYPVYFLSAYLLCVLIIAVPQMTKRIKSAIMNSRAAKKAASSEIVRRYMHDLAFRGSISIYNGMTANFIYAIFRIVTGIRYMSVWFISMAVYYMVLGSLRAYLLFSYRRGEKDEYLCYRRTA